jgi:hypothetical protein
MARLVPLVLLALALTACQLPEPAPEVVGPALIETQQQVERLRQDVDLLREDLERLKEQGQVLPLWMERLQRLEVLTISLLSPPPKKGRGKKPAPDGAPTPTQLVTIAHREARVEPTARGYFGKSGEQAFVYQPGRIYTLYLTRHHPTVIALEPGEHVLVGLQLDGDLFDVKTETAGKGERAADVMAVRPKFEQGAQDAFVVTDSGRRYLLHFVIGEVGMLVATFESPSITTVSQEPKLILPRPTP